MPMTRSSSDLINNFNEIFQYCQNYKEPLIINNNGQGNLAIMSMESYEELTGRLELYQLLDEGLEQVKQGKTKPLKESIKSIRAQFNL